MYIGEYISYAAKNVHCYDEDNLLKVKQIFNSKIEVFFTFKEKKIMLKKYFVLIFLNLASDRKIACKTSNHKTFNVKTNYGFQNQFFSNQNVRQTVGKLMRNYHMVPFDVSPEEINRSHKMVSQDVDWSFALEIEHEKNALKDGKDWEPPETDMEKQHNRNKRSPESNSDQSKGETKTGQANRAKIKGKSNGGGKKGNGSKAKGSKVGGNAGGLGVNNFLNYLVF